MYRHLSGMRSVDCCILLAVLGLLWTCSHSLKCRGEDDEEDDDFNEVARMCMRNMSNWDSPSTNNRYSSRNNDNNDSNNRNYGNRDNNNGNGCGDSNNNNGGSSRNNRNNNSNSRNNNNDGSYGSSSNNNNNNNNGGRSSGDNGGSSWSYGGGWQQSSSNRGSSQSGGSSDYDYYGSSRYRKSKNSSDRGRNNGSNHNNNNSMELSGNSPLESVEPCIIHCIFSEMQMLDDAGYPEKSSVKNIMTRKIRSSEVRDFIEDSIEECYDLLDTGNRRDRCDYSKTLALCLEEKGRRTCEDWDAPNSNGGK